MAITFFMFKVDIHVRKLYCAKKAMPTLPINIEDAARRDAEIEAALQMFRQFMLSKGFVEIHTPKLIAGSSWGGFAVFKLDYKGQPQLAKQMTIYRDFGWVFELALLELRIPTHRHLCEFTGLDVEMEIKKHYFVLLSHDF
ncbi:hypothetical protein CXB51_007625 [Gossypium anomalum]|uniref:Aminoacyl-tRNA synthetase class II (D/K/N) domain-containing protein n=1 Tax=Gossypium anomalum TaxID=47600 RepID=A0A8J6D7G6_9ROSI|nr:hypothetical protein CXB51_007625 [Gossypium anomalum]